MLNKLYYNIRLGIFWHYLIFCLRYGDGGGGGVGNSC
jgi:hypothetical protein